MKFLSATAAAAASLLVVSFAVAIPISQPDVEVAHIPCPIGWPNGDCSPNGDLKIRRNPEPESEPEPEPEPVAVAVARGIGWPPCPDPDNCTSKSTATIVPREPTGAPNSPEGAEIEVVALPIPTPVE